MSGNNDLLTTFWPYDKIIEFLDEFNGNLVKPNEKDYDHSTFVHGVHVFYITLPFLPAITHLNHEKHKLKNEQDRKNDFVLINRYFVTLNERVDKTRQIPQMHHLGLTDEPIEKMDPILNRHDYKAWSGYPTHSRYKQKKDYTKCENTIHLHDNVRIQVWTSIHAYFWAISFCDEQSKTTQS